LTSTDLEDVRRFVPSGTVQLTWSVIFGIMVFSAVCGNLMVIWIIVGHKKMRTITNLFLLNLAITDLMMTTFNVLFNFVYMLKSSWPFGHYYCIINSFVAS